MQLALRLALLTLLLACSDAADDTAPSLGPIEAVVDAKARSIWPGLLQPDESRQVPSISTYYQGEPRECWLFGPSTRQTADVFLFCHEGDAACPYNDAGQAQWQRMVGDPIFARQPGEVGYSPYWLVWVVRVGSDYAANRLKSVDAVHTAANAKQVRLEQHVFNHPDPFGPGPTVMHCALVLAGTQLAGQSDKWQPVADRQGWLKQYRVHFYDFSATEGVGPAAPVSQSRPLMIVSDAWLPMRDCAAGSTSPACAAHSTLKGAVSELHAEADWNGDGDERDTNLILSTWPYAAAVPYSPLWRINLATVHADRDADVPMIDLPGTASSSALRSPQDLQLAQKKGWVAADEALTETQTGVRVPGNDGAVYFSCPVRVPKPAQ